MASIIYITVIIFHITSVTSTDPFVYWTMDKTVGTKLIPESNTDTRFQGDFSSLGANPFEPGINGQAISIAVKTFDIVENIGQNDCIKHPDICPTGLSITFWLNINKWMDSDPTFDNIFRSQTNWATGDGPNLPGIYVGQGNENSLLLQVRTAAGRLHRATIPESNVLQIWGHIGMVWNKTSERLDIYVNGSKLLDSEYVSSPASTNITPTTAILVDLEVGTNGLGPTFKLDEFRIYYEVITPQDVANIFVHSLPAEETTTEVTEAPTTQSPTTQAPTTQARTTQAPTTQAPTTQAPTTQAPTTQAPTTQAPTTQAPTTQAPTTQAPTTQAPSTQAPTTQASTLKKDSTTTTSESTTQATTKTPATITTANASPTTSATTLKSTITNAAIVTMQSSTDKPTDEVNTATMETTTVRDVLGPFSLRNILLAAIVPSVSLCIIFFCILLCDRRRKRKHQRA